VYSHQSAHRTEPKINRIVAGQTEQVLILAELHKLIEGHLSVKWGKGYNTNLNRNSDNSKEIKVQADSLYCIGSNP
jgi:hypothetical protein